MCWVSLIKKTVKIFSLACFAWFAMLTTARSQDSLAYNEDYYHDEEIVVEEHIQDTLHVKPRGIDESKLDSFKKDKDFDYSQAPTVGENLWDRFWAWVRQFIGDLLRGAVNTSWSRVLLWVASLIVIVIIVLALLRVDAFKVLFRGADASSVKSVFHENIHAMDFETLIKEATENGDLRNAVRLIFLYSLKMLSDGHHIHWVPGKTNHDYLEEIKTEELKSGLNELSFYFDYAWYGGFSVSTVQFNKVSAVFTKWRSIIP